MKSISNFYLRYGIAVSLYKSNVPPDEVEKMNFEEVVEITKQEAKRLQKECVVKPPSGEFSGDDSHIGEKMWNENVYGTNNYSEYPEDPYPVLRTHVLTKVKKRSSLDVPSDNRAIQTFYPYSTRLSLGSKIVGNFKFRDGLQYAAAVTTFTPLKIAIAKNNDNKTVWTRIGLIPDLSIKNLMRFVELLNFKKTNSSLLSLKLSNNNNWRPETHEGMYFRDYPSWLFGSISLTTSLQEFIWENQKVEQAKKVLEELENSRVYIVSPHKEENRVEEVGSHLVDVIDQSFKGIVRKTIRTENQVRERKSENQAKSYTLHFRRWLKKWNHNSFQRFFSMRVDYPEEYRVLFKQFFKDMGYDEETIDIFREAGDFIGMKLFHQAKDKVNDGGDVFQKKSDLIASLESSLRGAESPSSFVYKLTREIERASQSNVSELREFNDLILQGEMDLERVNEVLFSYIRSSEKYSSQSSSKESDSEESGVEEEEEIMVTT